MTNRRSKQLSRNRGYCMQGLARAHIAMFIFSKPNKEQWLVLVLVYEQSNKSIYIVKRKNMRVPMPQNQKSISERVALKIFSSHPTSAPVTSIRQLRAGWARSAHPKVANLAQIHGRARFMSSTDTCGRKARKRQAHKRTRVGHACF